MENKLTYTQMGDVLIPNLTLGEQPDRDLGKYGRMRLRYLKEHAGAANSRLEQMMPELAKAAGATEQLKASDPMKWVGLMNNCKAQAEEIILTELIYS